LIIQIFSRLELLKVINFASDPNYTVMKVLRLKLKRGYRKGNIAKQFMLVWEAVLMWKKTHIL